MYLFDLDGTLIDSNHIWSDVDHLFLERRSLPYTYEYYEGVAHTIFPLAAAFTKQYYNLSESCEEIMAEWMELAQGRYALVSLKPSVREYLDQCKAQGKHMAIFTSCVSSHCHIALSSHQLEGYFEQIIFAQDIGMDKATPEAFLKAAELLHTSPRNCTFFDDSVKACRSAKAVGMQVIGVYDHFFRQDQQQMLTVCDKMIYNFSELL